MTHACAARRGSRRTFAPVTGRWYAPSMIVRDATSADAASIARIYNPFIRDTGITFEEVELGADEMRARIEAHTGEWLVATDGDAVVGYAYAAPWRARSAYRFSVEITVYVDPARPRRGVGSTLYGALFPRLEQRGVHAILAGIALPNDASVALHERFGMKKVAHFEQTGFKFGRWIDVGYWQKVVG